MVDLVAVTQWRPRLPLLPLWLPSFVTAMITWVTKVTPLVRPSTEVTGRYTRTLTLSLFLLNVLPLSRLDGGILIDAVLCRLDRPSSVEVDIEIGSRDRDIPSRRPRSRFLTRILRGVAAGLLGGCVLLGAYDSILRRYVQPIG